MAKDDSNQSRLTLLEREMLPTNHEKEEVGPLRRCIVKHGWLSLLDMTPYGRQQDFEDSPPGWPEKPTYG